MSQVLELSVRKRLYYSLGTMVLLITILVLAILLFVSFGPGASWPRGITGIILSFFSFSLIWLSLINNKSVFSTWTGIIAGMTTWMVIGEISHQFGFAVIEAEEGIVLLIFISAITAMLWSKKQLSWGFQVFTASFLLNWWGHAILLPQLFLAERFDASFFYLTYTIAGALCLAGFAALLFHIIRKPADKMQLIYYGLWLYALLVTGIEGVTRITEQTFGH